MAIRKPNNIQAAAQSFIEGADAPIQAINHATSEMQASVAQFSVPGSMLIRFNDPSIPALLAAIAEADDRSKHHIALKAISIGLEQMREDFNI